MSKIIITTTPLSNFSGNTKLHLKKNLHTSPPGESNGQTVFAGKYCIKDEDLDTSKRYTIIMKLKLGLPAHLTENTRSKSSTIDLDFNINQQKIMKDNMMINF